MSSPGGQNGKAGGCSPPNGGSSPSRGSIHRKQQIIELADVIVNGTAWFAGTLSERDVLLVFPLLLFATEEQRKVMHEDSLTGKLAEIYVIVGKHRTADRSINGMPMFWSCSMIDREGLDTAIKLAEETKTAKEKVIQQTFGK